MKDHDETLKNIAEYTKILNDKKEMTKVIIKELDRFKKNYSKERKTVIILANANAFKFLVTG